MIESNPVLMRDRGCVQVCASKDIIYRRNPNLLLSCDEEEETPCDVKIED